MGREEEARMIPALLRRPRVRDWLARNERRLVRRLTQAAAGVGVTALAVANPAVLVAPAPAAAGSTTPELISTREALTVFEGTSVRGREGVEESARLLVASTGGLPTGPGTFGPWVRAGDLSVGLDRCPARDVVVSWAPPQGEYGDGAYIEPLGPEPDEDTERVNGVVLCRSSRFAFVGFEAAWERGRWRIAVVPSLDEDVDEPLLEGEADATGAAPAEVVAGAEGAPALPPPDEWAGAPIEPLAPYLPQTTCDPAAKPGVLGFRDLLLATYPGSRNLGIGRVCEADGVSEHKEGRAFDWGVDIENPAERAAADQVLAWMLGPDASGEPHAIARRLGLMYVIWDGQIWSSFLASEGWRPYVGRSAHRDHIHFSFDWNGALATTSFWKGGFAGVAPGSVAPDLPLRPVAPVLPLPAMPLPALPMPGGFFGPPPEDQTQAESSGSAPPPTTTTTAPPPSTTTTTTAPPPSTTTTTAPAAPTPALTTPTTLRLGSL